LSFRSVAKESASSFVFVFVRLAVILKRSVAESKDPEALQPPKPTEPFSRDPHSQFFSTPTQK
jgi:hypothetical protein